MRMREIMAIVEAAAKVRSPDDLEDYDGEAIKDGCTKRIPDEIEFVDFAFVWWVGGDEDEMQKKRRAFNKAEDEAVEKTVRHSSMSTGQQCINPEKVQALMDEPTDNLPTIHRWNGYNILFDGNHRVTADILKGRLSSRCRVLDLDRYFDREGNLKKKLNESQELEDQFGPSATYGIKGERFPDKSDAYNCNCTNYARQVYRAFPDRTVIWGFDYQSNPTSAAARYYTTGHDFAIVDGRWIVDGWVKNAVPLSDRTIFDLENPNDADEIRRLYGDRDKWEEAPRNWYPRLSPPVKKKRR